MEIVRGRWYHDTTMRGRTCTICDHPKCAEIDRRLTKGETAQALAREFSVPQTTLYRHRKNCAGLKTTPRADQIERSRGTVALASLPSRDELGGMYRQLGDRIDAIVQQAQGAGSLAIAVSGLNSLRQTFDSMSRLAGHDAAQAQVNVNVAISAEAIAQALAHALGSGQPIKEIEGVVCEAVE